MKQGLFVLALIAAPVSAQTGGMPLWGDLKTGMTKAEVAAVAKDRVSLSPQCVARLDTDFKADRLEAVRLGYTDGERAKCGEAIREGLTAKYGEPVKTTASEDVPYNSPKVTSTYTYRKDGLRIVLRHREDNGKWWLTYSPDVDTGAKMAL